MFTSLVQKARCLMVVAVGAVALMSSASPAIADENPLDTGSFTSIESTKDAHEVTYLLSGIPFSNLRMVTVKTDLGGGTYAVDFYQEDSSFHVTGSSTVTNWKDYVKVAQGLYIPSTVARAVDPMLIQASDPNNPASVHARLALTKGVLVTATGNWSIWTLGSEAFVPGSQGSVEQIIESQPLSIAGVFGQVENPNTAVREVSSAGAWGIGIGLEILSRTGWTAPLPRVESPALNTLRPPLVNDFETCMAVTGAWADQAAANFTNATANCVIQYGVAIKANLLVCAPLIVSPVKYAICMGSMFALDVWSLIRCNKNAEEARQRDQQRVGEMTDECKQVFYFGAIP